MLEPRPRVRQVFRSVAVQWYPKARRDDLPRKFPKPRRRSLVCGRGPAPHACDRSHRSYLPGKRPAQPAAGLGSSVPIRHSPARAPSRRPAFRRPESAIDRALAGQSPQLACGLYLRAGDVCRADAAPEPQASGLRPDRRGGALPCGWSLLTTRRLTSENRGIIDRARFVRLEESVCWRVAALRRLEARHTVLQDPAYARLFAERAQAIQSGLATLRDLVSTPEEGHTVVEAAEQLRRYRALAERPSAEKVGTEQAAMRLETLAQRLYGQSSMELRRRGTAAGVSRSRAVSWRSLRSWPAWPCPSRSRCSKLSDWSAPERLRAAARDIEAPQALEPIPIRGRDEIAELTSAFNRMATRLRELILSSSTCSRRSHATCGPSPSSPGPPSARERCARLAGSASGVARREHPDEPDRLPSLVSQLLDRWEN